MQTMAFRAPFRGFWATIVGNIRVTSEVPTVQTAAPLQATHQLWLSSIILLIRTRYDAPGRLYQPPLQVFTHNHSATHSTPPPSSLLLVTTSFTISTFREKPLVFVTGLCRAVLQVRLCSCSTRISEPVELATLS